MGALLCVPNFSEGRRPEVIGAILGALRAPGVRLVHHQADPEHNRLDATIAGEPTALRAALLDAARVAIAAIDMATHRGGHPRMGAVDVVPFVPIGDTSMDDVIAVARAFAAELASALDVPVYCYDRAALTPDRRSLADVRRGEVEGLREAVAGGERLPDFGPTHIGGAGATAVGARKPLVAFNVYLDGTEDDAKAIAREVRESSGGLPAVRAIGFAVPDRGCVTVSMNLVDHDVTTPRVAFEAVASRATARGMRVRSSEIVGLVPAAALAPGDAQHLLLEGFDPDAQILERVVAGTGDRSVRAFLDALASAAPVPGGGAAAAVAAAAGAALVGMVAALTVGKAGYEGVHGRMAAIGEAAQEARAALLDLADRDGEAFEAVMAAFALPRGDDDAKARRTDAIQAALVGAAAVPLETVRRSAPLLDLAAEALGTGNANAASDALSGAELLAAGMRSAAANVRINAASIRDDARAAALRSEVDDLLARAETTLATIRAAFPDRVG